MRSLFLAAAFSIGCTGSCPAWDARGEGPCNLVLGYAWDGHGCVALSGCDCVGRDCERLRGDDDGAACRASACERGTDAGGG